LDWGRQGNKLTTGSVIPAYILNTTPSVTVTFDTWNRCEGSLTINQQHHILRSTQTGIQREIPKCHTSTQFYSTRIGPTEKQLFDGTQSEIYNAKHTTGNRAPRRPGLREEDDDVRGAPFDLREALARAIVATPQLSALSEHKNGD